VSGSHFILLFLERLLLRGRISERAVLARQIVDRTESWLLRCRQVWDRGAGLPLRELSIWLRGKRLRLRRELEAARNALVEMAKTARDAARLVE